MKTEFAVPGIGSKYTFLSGEQVEIVDTYGFRGLGGTWVVKVGKILQLMGTQDLRFEVFGEYSLTPANGDRLKRRVENYTIVEYEA